MKVRRKRRRDRETKRRSENARFFTSSLRLFVSPSLCGSTLLLRRRRWGFIQRLEILLHRLLRLAADALFVDVGGGIFLGGGGGLLEGFLALADQRLAVLDEIGGQHFALLIVLRG